MFHAARFDTVEVVDLNGVRLGLVSTDKTLCGYGDKRYERTVYFLHTPGRFGSRRSSHKDIWEKMHEWSDVIAKQNTERYQAAQTV